MRNRVTIKDVAKEAGVSIKTVSNVINNTGSMRPQTRKRVESVMKKFGYTINVSARNLKTGSSKLIGLGVFDFSQPFGSYFCDKVIEAARNLDYGVIVSTYGVGGDGVSTIIDETYRVGADGWIFFVDGPLRNEGAILEQPYPVVMASDYDSYGKVDHVTMPNFNSMHDVVGRLIDSGSKNIAVIGSPCETFDYDAIMNAKEGTQELRLQGYLTAYEDRGLAPEPSLFVPMTHGLTTFGGASGMKKLLNSGRDFDAVICLNDAVAIGAMHEVTKHGIKIPEEMQIVGFDNVPEDNYSNPSLTSIDPHTELYARRAVEMLIERIEGYHGPVRSFESMYTLVKRGSTK
ncbi:transcriptional regulator, LacI family protein [Bifidobacterium bombi DSM 19703]|uniref:Transcriptional regulator, LacI family protein n=1 Tax=Bifidobacterium bombi DSM 19703 TaxID=1341695 RepID=A0A086BP90_9BIFI|nr:transcriptional regulator, LacI family protein [Bifidobacterium bombi DSM 19703]